MTFYQTEFVTKHGQMMAASVMATLPIIILYVLVQRQFIEGIAGTGIKGDGLLAIGYWRLLLTS